ncbi:MAG: PAS domain S-box protein [Kiritimatiellaeota bacterium]|nr:PAS domain S-box protein [Kiritimatiellota bacterium]
MSTMDVIQAVEWSMLIAFMITWFAMIHYRQQDEARELNKYRRIFDLSPELIVLLHPVAGRIMEINSRGTELTGFSAETLVGRSIPDWPYLPDESKQLILQSLKKRMLGEHLPPFEMEFHTQSGQRLIGRIGVAPLTDNKGRVLADLVMISDITEHKLTEERLQKMLSDMQRHNRLMVGREMRVVELKKEVNELLKKMGQPAAYPVIAAEYNLYATDVELAPGVPMIDQEKPV